MFTHPDDNYQLSIINEKNTQLYSEWQIVKHIQINLSNKFHEKVLVIQKKDLPLHPQTRKQLSDAEMRK